MPKKLKLMADYDCHPLWELADDDAFCNLNPDQMKLSDELVESLHAWADRFNRTLNQEYPPNSGFATQQDEDAFETEGLRLFAKLQLELSAEYKVVYYSIKNSRLVE